MSGLLDAVLVCNKSVGKASVRTFDDRASSWPCLYLLNLDSPMVDPMSMTHDADALMIRKSLFWWKQLLFCST